MCVSISVIICSGKMTDNIVKKCQKKNCNVMLCFL